jgi:hypothetical protein
MALGGSHPSLRPHINPVVNLSSRPFSHFTRILSSREYPRHQPARACSGASLANRWPECHGIESEDAVGSAQSGVHEYCSHSSHAEEVEEAAFLRGKLQLKCMRRMPST